LFSEIAGGASQDWQFLLPNDNAFDKGQERCLPAVEQFPLGLIPASSMFPQLPAAYQEMHWYW
jgi:hypothetical protein